MGFLPTATPTMAEANVSIETRGSSFYLRMPVALAVGTDANASASADAHASVTIRGDLLAELDATLIPALREAIDQAERVMAHDGNWSWVDGEGKPLSEIERSDTLLPFWREGVDNEQWGALIAEAVSQTWLPDEALPLLRRVMATLPDVDAVRDLIDHHGAVLERHHGTINTVLNEALFGVEVDYVNRLDEAGVAVPAGLRAKADRERFEKANSF